MQNLTAANMYVFFIVPLQLNSRFGNLDLYCYTNLVLTFMFQALIPKNDIGNKCLNLYVSFSVTAALGSPVVPVSVLPLLSPRHCLQLPPVWCV